MPQTTTATSPPTPALTPAGERILTAASALFYAHGINAVGVDRIAEEAGTTKKTLYDRFRSKEGLTVAYLRRRCASWQDHLARRLETAPPGPERPLAVLDALAEWMTTNERGCGFVNAYAELAGTGHAGLAVILEEKTTVRELYVRLAADLGVPDPDRLGRQLALLHEGAITATTAGGDPDALPLARETAAQLVEAARAAG